MSADTDAVVGEGDVIRADGDEATSGDFKFAMKFDKTFGLTAVVETETSTAEDKDQGMRSLHIEELAALRGVIAELVVRAKRTGRMSDRMDNSPPGLYSCPVYGRSVQLPCLAALWV